MRIHPRRFVMVRVASIGLLGVLFLTGCGGGGAGGGSGASDFEAGRFVPELRLGYFPVEPGRAWTYEGEEGGLPIVEEVRTLPARRAILGVACTGIEESFYVDGVLTDRSTEWYAQDVDGNVWRFGEEASTFLGDVEFPSPDSWVASLRGIRPWLALPAAPRVGDRFTGARPDGLDTFLVAATARTVVTPAGTFEGCVEFVQNPDDPEDTDIILYAPNVGRVSESSPTGRSTLVGFTPGP
jgi:hypothetical protein